MQEKGTDFFSISVIVIGFEHSVSGLEFDSESDSVICR